MTLEEGSQGDGQDDYKHTFVEDAVTLSSESVFFFVGQLDRQVCARGISPSHAIVDADIFGDASGSKHLASLYRRKMVPGEFGDILLKLLVGEVI